VRIEIITIGNELLDGTRVDTNTPFIGAKLAALGGEIVRATTVPDAPEAIAAALERAVAEADVVVATGGLGPTTDDRTKQTVARVLGRPLTLDEEVLARVRAHFESRGAEMPEINIGQAMVPEGARPIENRRGTAPGLVMEDDGVLVFLLPGVPQEMRSMVETYVVPFLEGRGLKRSWEERLIRTTGISESAVAERIAPTAKRLARVEVAYLPGLGGVDLRVTGRGETLAAAARTADRAADRITDLLGPFVYARGPESMEEVIGYLLTMAGATLAVAESCTGGLVGARITRVPGSSDYFGGGVVAYSNDVKKRLLGVRSTTLRSAGAVSGETASEMAEGVRSKCHATHGLAITGIAGPGGGTPEKPVGLVYTAVASKSGTRVSEHRLRGDREAVRERASQAALDLLRRVLLGVAEE
jgi:nicotinamide-nucleotide amidase